MKNNNSLYTPEVLLAMRKMFTRRMIGYNFTTKKFYLRKDIAFDVAEDMLRMIENLYLTFGFKDDDDKVVFYALKDKFYRDLV